MKIKRYKNKKGMTLVELMVSISILGIVTTGMSTFFIYIWESRYDEINIGQSSLAASQSISKMSRDIRRAAQADSGAYLIDSGDDFDFIFYSDIDADEHMERVHYYVDGTSIMMGTAEPILGTSPTYPVGDENVTTLANNVTNEVSEPIFSYYDSSNSVIATPITASNVRLVKLHISVNTDPDRINDVVIESAVSLRNLNN